MKIIVYGLGKRGIEFIKDVEELSEGIEIIAVSDKNCLQNSVPLPYIPISNINKCVFDYIVVTPQKYYGEIKEDFLKQGIGTRKIKSEKELWKIYGANYGKRYCNLCDNTIFDWKYIGEESNIFQHKNIVGASRRKGGCPICGSSDRTRYVYYILKKYTSIFKNTNSRILHFAPEQTLTEKLRDKGRVYVSADIEPGRADVVEDITNMSFQDNEFDYIICNHIMEHILDEERAFFEIRRCLNQEGILIFTIPICWEQVTIENPDIQTEADRIKNYGQKDHVRLYGNDIVKRIEKYGFEVDLHRSDEILCKKDIVKFGYIYKDSVLLCKKVS